MNSTRLILSMDTGIDDALALAYLSTFNDIDVLGVIGTYGNVRHGPTGSSPMPDAPNSMEPTDWAVSAPEPMSVPRQRATTVVRRLRPAGLPFRSADTRWTIRMRTPRIPSIPYAGAKPTIGCLPAYGSSSIRYDGMAMT